MSRPAVPRFRLMPLMLWGLFSYFLLATFFGLFFLASDLLKSEATLRLQGTRPPGTTSWSWMVELATLGVGILAIVGWHRPLRRTFAALRRGQTPAEGELRLARRRIFFSPLVLGIALPALSGLVLAAVALGHVLSSGPGLPLPTEVRAMPVSLLLLVLSGFFTYLWQRHRIQHHYLTHLFTPTELATRLPPSRDRGIGPTLAIVAVLSALLPVSVVMTLLATGVSAAPPVSQLTADQWTLLLGNEALGRQAQGLLADYRLDQVPLVLINTIDTWRILIGSVLGVGLMLGYVFFVFRWVAKDLTRPLYHLRDAMRRIDEGNAEAPQPVLSSNEIGELTLGFNRMMKGLAERDRIKGLFGQYLTSEVSEAILDGRVNLSGDRYDVTVLFTDIRDFTALSDQLEPEEVFAFLNEYLDGMIEVLVARGGFIDKFLGDGILAVFGLPVASDHHAEDALKAALDMKTKLADLNERRVASGRVPIAIGSGLHSGLVIAGNVGSSRKLQFTVIGDTVNLASRLEGLNKTWGSSVTLSDETWRRLPAPWRDQLGFVPEPSVEIRGKKEPLTLYRLD